MNNGSSAPENNNGPKPLELTEYDMQRRPHKAITDSTEIRIFPRMLAAELCCPICLDLLTNTMTSKECLHRFCCECITTALMRGNKECPTCRKKLVSKRSLRPDPNFDSLINKIWPDRQVYEKLQEKALEIFQQQSNIKALQKSIEAGMKEQARNRRQRVQGSYDYERRKKRGRPPEHPDRSENNSPISNSPEFSGEGDMEVDQLHERNEDGTIAPGTSGTEPAANGVSHSATNSFSDSDDSLDSSSDSSLSDSSDDTTDTSSTSSSGSAVQANSSKIQLHTTQSVETDGLQLPESSITDVNQSVAPPSTTCTLKDRINKWVEKSISEPAAPVENMERLERRVDEELDIADVQSGGNVLDIEAELLPAKSLLKRSGIPAPLLRRRYIRTKGDTTMEHLGEFLYQVCCEELSSDASADPGTATVSGDSSTSNALQDVPRPDHFYVYSRFGGHSVNKIFGNENVLSALHAQKRGDHLMIFFDTAPLDIYIKSVLDEVVYGDFLK